MSILVRTHHAPSLRAPRLRLSPARLASARRVAIVALTALLSGALAASLWRVAPLPAPLRPAAAQLDA